MGEIFATVVGILFMFGSISIFMSILLENNDSKHIKHNNVDNDMIDVIIADDLFNDDN